MAKPRIAKGQHLFDLIGCREIEPEIRAGMGYVSVYLPRDEVACIVQLDCVMTATRNEDELTVEVTELYGESALVVADVNGEVLIEQTAKVGRNTLDMSAIEEGKTPACVKLLTRGQLVDVAEVP